MLMCFHIIRLRRIHFNLLCTKTPACRSTEPGEDKELRWPSRVEGIGFRVVVGKSKELSRPAFVPAPASFVVNLPVIEGRLWRADSPVVRGAILPGRKPAVAV